MPYLMPSQNISNENNISNYGFGKLLENEIEELKNVFATLKE